MISATVKRIDVSRMYFGVDAISSMIRDVLFDKESDGVINMNYVISKPYAIDKALDLFKTQRSKYTDLYVSVDAVKIKQIKDYMGKRVFEKLDGELSGWLFFFDSMPFANWEHPCNYLLIIDHENYELIEYNRGLDDQIQIEKID